MCINNNSCNGNGWCQADVCDFKGFLCKCFDNHHGDYCQYEKRKYYPCFSVLISFTQQKDNCTIVAKKLLRGCRGW